MGYRANTALLCTLLGTLCLVVSFVTPWFWTKVDKSDKSYPTTNCFIDGTCRNGEKVFKDNGGAQVMYDWTLALMLVALAFHLLFVHLVWAVWSPRYNTFPGRWILVVLSGCLQILLIVAAVCTFGIGVPQRLN